MTCVTPKARGAGDTTDKALREDTLPTQLMDKDLSDIWAIKQKVHAQVLGNLDFFFFL